MLVLTRKKGESIMIGGGIEVVIVGIEGDQVKVGIQAPRHIEVYRKEVYEMIQEANREASESASAAVEMKQWVIRKKYGDQPDQQ